MATLEDEVAQLKGVCDVAYCPGDLLAMPTSILKMAGLMKEAGGIMEACHVA
jgi:hypothetical protein